MHAINTRKSPATPWWQRSSSWPVNSGNAGLDGGVIVESGRKGGDKFASFGISFLFRRRRLSSRVRKLRHVTDHDSDEFVPSKYSSLDHSLARSSSAETHSSSDLSLGRSSSSGSQPSPLPLPPPEVQALLRRDANSSPYFGKAHLPSPTKSHPRRDGDKSRETLDSHSESPGDEAHLLQRFFNQAAGRTRENQVSHSRKSPAREPEKLSGPSLDASFCYWLSPEKKTASSIDNSPTQSPNRSSRNATGSASPLTRRGNNAQANNVHRLPLPPGAASPCRKQDQMPLKGQWQKGKLIGRGTFGSVYIASNRKTGALCAMKEVEIFPDDPKSAECIRQLEQEIKVLSNLKHPNIVQYYGSEIVGDRFFIYLEYVHPGSINKFIRDHCGAITESVVRSFTRHILCGLAYLHSKKTIHRDIKGANLLVDAYGVVKLADFGMAKHLSGQAGPLSLKGSPYWMAPELLQSAAARDPNADHALGVDIWSLGCTIIEMMNGKPPWSENEGAAAMFKALKESPPIPDSLSPEGKDFLRCCFCRNPADRPTASMLLEHQFIKNSHQLHFPHCVRSPNGLKLTDNLQIKKEHYRYQKHEKGKLFPNTLPSKELRA
ncbi:PREDICTED: mitogen-activated protein kinase kinase kinase YODA-like [Ipomoea nil]|uniref:mitogen-activated protein kinase kinase kinase YODA-like n=1 Tax=Ipomoea nil TaxID=35883 RepID=UPI000900FCC6|nr:PREDICTED: mitogen-activated protein kinase kinase kinase YODA-like [Ipomoea nil]